MIGDYHINIFLVKERILKPIRSWGLPQYKIIYNDRIAGQKEDTIIILHRTIRNLSYHELTIPNFLRFECW